MKKQCVVQILQRTWETFLYENNSNSFKFSYKFVFITFLLFWRNQKLEYIFRQVGGLVTRNVFVFCLYQVALYVKGMLSSIDFYKIIFLHVFPVRTIVPLGIPNFGVSMVIFNSVDIFCRWCKLNFGPMWGQVKMPNFSERIALRRQYFHLLHKFLRITS